jgi:hypothetical protein
MSIKRSAIPLTVIVVFGMLLAGCTQPSGTGPVTTAAPVASPDGAVTAAGPPQPALNETVPVPVVQTQDTLRAAANETGSGGSAYNNETGAVPVSVENETSGGLFINIERGGSVDGVKVFIAREGMDLSQIEYTYLPDRTLVEGENPGYIPVIIPPDGRSDLIRLPTGNYTAYLPDWNSGEPEKQSFTVREDHILTIYFMGFSAAGAGGCGC